MGKVSNFRVVPRQETETIVAEAREGAPPGTNVYETEPYQKRLAQLEEWLENERIRQGPNRYQQAVDEDFYDGLQWSDEDALILQQRGQAPLVYNKVKVTTKWVTGTEKRTRMDFRVLPRSSNDRNEAENKTKLMKYVSDVNRSAFARSRAFEDAVKVGIGWLECGVRGDPTKFLIYDRYESWRNILYDSHGFERDGSDWRYLVRQKWVDLDVAQSIWPEHYHKLAAGAMHSDLADLHDQDEWYLGRVLSDRDQPGEYIGRRTYIDSTSLLFNRRPRVKVYEGWYRTPARVKLIVGGGLSGSIFDPSDEIQQWMVSRQACQLIERSMMVMRCGVWIRGSFLADVPSPYRHNDFPFTAVWGERRGRDGMAYGAIRNQRDPQEDFNKRVSKALHSFSTRRVVMEEGAVRDKEELREEVARPDAIIEKKVGAELEIAADLEIGEEHLKFAQLDAQMIEQSAGITDELLGRRTNAVSGKAIEARQEQGTTTTTDYFDNLRFAAQVHGQKVLSLCEQYITFPMQVRVLGERQGYDFVELNKPGQADDGQPSILNDITRSQADFIVAAQDYRDSLRQAASEQLMDMLGKLAQFDVKMALQLLDDVLEMWDIPGAEAIIKTVREITGKKPRDYVPSPQEQQAMQQAAQQAQAEQQAAKEIAMRGAVAEVAEREANVAKLQAETQQIAAEAQAGNADSGVRARYEDRLRQIRDDTAQLVASLNAKVLEVRLDAQRRIDEAQRTHDSAIEVARVRAETDLERARIDALGEAEVERIRQEAEDRRAAMQSEADQNIAAIGASADERVSVIEADAQKQVDRVQKQIDQLKAKLGDTNKAVREAKKAATARKPSTPGRKTP